jgi:hypothetical protein
MRRLVVPLTDLNVVTGPNRSGKVCMPPMTATTGNQPYACGVSNQVPHTNYRKGRP